MPPSEDPSLALRAFALTLPGATEDYPWGERVVKVKGKVFAFLGRDDPDHPELGFSVKLPVSGATVLERPQAKPTGYGLGKSGWVSVTFAPGEEPEMAVLRAWIVESYRAVAPKRLAAQLGSALGEDTK